MKKSNERITLEHRIRNAHKESRTIAEQMIIDEFGGDFDKALSDNEFIGRMHKRVKEKWAEYTTTYRELEKLEEKEGYPAMHLYAEQLDLIANNLPEQNKEFCYHPFSGVDFYWARIFKKIVFEDIAFDKTECQNMWWDAETYSLKRRDEIISTLKKQKIIPDSTSIKFLTGDAEIYRPDNQFNNKESTLLVKGGHSATGYIQARYNEEQLDFGAIIIVSAAESLKELNKFFSANNYYKQFSLKGKNFIAPYAMDLVNIHIFLKNN